MHQFVYLLFSVFREQQLICILFQQRIHPILPYGIMALNALLAGIACVFLRETRFKPTLETMEMQEEKTLRSGDKQEESGNLIEA